ncbi:hypothetical protein ACEPAF_6731 [Sanghuangporus sanghuang]
MTAATLPSNIHAELALDQGRISRNGSERSGARSVTHAQTAGTDQHARVQSLHGVIVETAQYIPSPNHGTIEEEPASINGTLSGAELAAALDNEEEEEEDDISTRRSIMHDAQWHEQEKMKRNLNPQNSFPPGQASINNSSPEQQAYGGSYPKSILQVRSQTLSPPPRSSSCSAPASAPARQQAFPDRPRFVLTDSGPVSAPPSPRGAESEQGHPPIRRAVSDSHPHSAPNSPGLGVTPPMRRGRQTQPSTPKYATFEDMGIQSKNADKEKDCVIM